MHRSAEDIERCARTVAAGVRRGEAWRISCATVEEGTAFSTALRCLGLTELEIDGLVTFCVLVPNWAMAELRRQKGETQ